MEEFLDWLKHLAHEGRLGSFLVTGSGTLTVNWSNETGKHHHYWSSVERWRVWMDCSDHVPV